MSLFLEVVYSDSIELFIESYIRVLIVFVLSSASRLCCYVLLCNVVFNNPLVIYIKKLLLLFSLKLAYTVVPTICSSSYKTMTVCRALETLHHQLP